MNPVSRSARVASLILAATITGSAAVWQAAPAVALERRAARAPDEPDRWERAATCQILYYNTCQGWIWTWSGWDPTDRIGVAFGTGPGFSGQSLSELLVFVAQGSPSGYGFTGTLEVHAADGQDCPAGPPLRSQPFLPASGWNTVDWFTAPVDVSGGDFIVSYQLAASALPDPVTFTSDHPEAGPTGVAACGTCYPTTRAVRSYYYGNATTPLCPGTTLSVAACSVEWLWDCTVQCTTPVETESWGQIKALYR